MRTLEIGIGIILLGGAVWTGFKTYRGRGTSSYFIMVFAMFLAALGLFFVFGAFSAMDQGLPDQRQLDQMKSEAGGRL